MLLPKNTEKLMKNKIKFIILKKIWLLDKILVNVINDIILRNTC